jgi:hypothetical protein
MSLPELKEQAARLSPAERLDLAVYLVDLEEQNEAEFREAINRRMKAMDQGRKVTQEQIEAEHRRLLEQGKP